MLETGFPFICVGNSSFQLLEDARALGQPHLHYEASGTHGRGVVEGIQFFRKKLASRETREGYQSPITQGVQLLQISK